MPFFHQTLPTSGSAGHEFLIIGLVQLILHTSVNDCFERLARYAELIARIFSIRKIPLDFARLDREIGMTFLSLTREWLDWFELQGRWRYSRIYTSGYEL